MLFIKKLLGFYSRPIVMAPPNTGNDSSNKKEVIKTDQTYKGSL